VGISNAILARALPDKMTILLGLFVFHAILIEVLTPARIRRRALSKSSREGNLQIGSKFVRRVLFGVVVGLLIGCPVFTAMAQQLPPAYIEPGYDPRFYLGDEDARLGWAHLLSGEYGLAERYYRRAVEATRQNGSAWIGLAAAYDRLKRFDLADLAYRRAIWLEGENYIILNNWGYSFLLRGDIRRARRLLERAISLAPGDPTIVNNLAVMDAGLAYFHGFGP
jgi:tetratricopeptide (TPR) repeat protein